jgi:hypothetical protein
MFLLADMMTWAEVGASLCSKSANYKGGQGRSTDFMNACARLFVREVFGKVTINGLKIIHGSDVTLNEALKAVGSLNMGSAMKHTIKDMDRVAEELVR